MPTGSLPDIPTSWLRLQNRSVRVLSSGRNAAADIEIAKRCRISSGGQSCATIIGNIKLGEAPGGSGHCFGPSSLRLLGNAIVPSDLRWHASNLLIDHPACTLVICRRRHLQSE